VPWVTVPCSANMAGEGCVGIRERRTTIRADALDTREATATVVAVAKGSPNPQAVLCRRTDFVHMVCLLQAAAGT